MTESRRAAIYRALRMTRSSLPELGTSETGFNAAFCYRLNPDYTSSLEFDPPEVATP